MTVDVLNDCLDVTSDVPWFSYVNKGQNKKKHIVLYKKKIRIQKNKHVTFYVTKIANYLYLTANLSAPTPTASNTNNTNTVNKRLP